MDTRRPRLHLPDGGSVAVRRRETLRASRARLARRLSLAKKVVSQLLEAHTPTAPSLLQLAHDLRGPRTAEAAQLARAIEEGVEAVCVKALALAVPMFQEEGVQPLLQQVAEEHQDPGRQLTERQRAVLVHIQCPEGLLRECCIAQAESLQDTAELRERHTAIAILIEGLENLDDLLCALYGQSRGDLEHQCALHCRQAAERLQLFELISGHRQEFVFPEVEPLLGEALGHGWSLGLFERKHVTTQRCALCGSLDQAPFGALLVKLQPR
mmetsp:Transcript_18400/g.50642  ORF Transcript_18400/g.50642 Transcript_18400/m.50642 type:complete len:269 (-) Transcript_18400:1261-2067(-)